MTYLGRIEPFGGHDPNGHSWHEVYLLPNTATVQHLDHAANSPGSGSSFKISGTARIAAA
jgi:hypothetical protein